MIYTAGMGRLHVRGSRATEAEWRHGQGHAPLAQLDMCDAMLQRRDMGCGCEGVERVDVWRRRRGTSPRPSSSYMNLYWQRQRQHGHGHDNNDNRPTRVKSWKGSATTRGASRCYQLATLRVHPSAQRRTTHLPSASQAPPKVSACNDGTDASWEFPNAVTSRDLVRYAWT
jgi:hypothetical protein